jgi:hypothetical protein
VQELLVLDERKLYVILKKKVLIWRMKEKWRVEESRFLK